MMHLNIEIDNTLGGATHGVQDCGDSGDSQRWKMAWDGGTATADGAK